MMLNIKVHKYVGFRSWSRFLAVSLQVTWVINPAVGCHYFPPGLLLPPQPLRGLLFLLWTEAQWVWAVCLRLLPDTVATAIWTWAFCAWFQHANHGGGATVLKVGGQNVIRERSERKKNFVPPTFGKVGGTIFVTRAGYEQANNYQHWIGLHWNLPSVRRINRLIL